MSDEFLSRYLRRFDVQIAAGQSVTSAPIELAAMTLLWVEVPAGMDGSVITALAGATNVVANAVPVMGEYGSRPLLFYSNIAARLTCPVGNSRLSSHEFLWLRTSSGDGVTPVVQTAARTLRICARHLF
jgi:hypothetical protein